MPGWYDKGEPKQSGCENKNRYEPGDENPGPDAQHKGYRDTQPTPKASTSSRGHGDEEGRECHFDQNK